MLQVRKIVLRGTGVDDAEISFGVGANILSGESDTGKSYLVHCLDFILGAKAMKKRFEKANRYSELLVEFENSDGQKLTLRRALAGGNLQAYYSSIDDALGAGKKVLPKRAARSKDDDVSAILFPFAGISEAQLRKNVRGELQRLTIRTLLPLILVDEKSIIADGSPVTGESGFDVTARKRMLAYLLTGKDDKGLVSSEKREMVRARIVAQVALIERLMGPLEARLANHNIDEVADSKARVEEAIYQLSDLLKNTSSEREMLQEERRSSLQSFQHAESQVLAIDELQKRYDLLDDRYRSDLRRLDFLAEGTHYLGALQLVNCPCCSRPLASAHPDEPASNLDSEVYREAAQAEAAKILALIADLGKTSQALSARKSAQERDLNKFRTSLDKVEQRLQKFLEPVTKLQTEELGVLVERKVHLESIQQEQMQLQSLQAMKAALEATDSGQPDQVDWEGIPADRLTGLCSEIASLLIEWRWSDHCEVYFDQLEFDIVIDGQVRQSHGKGVRAILYSAFVLGLLRFCKKNSLPHPGFVVIDSPLTSYKKDPARSANDLPVAAGIESGFWRSLERFGPGIQVLVIENKEPPPEVAKNVNYQRFSGEAAQDGERKGFIPEYDGVYQVPTS